VVQWLPYKDDLRDIELGEVQGAEATPSEEALKAATNILRCFKGKDTARNPYYNTAVQRFYAHLEALALDEDDPRQIADSLLPQLANLHPKTGDFINNFIAEVYGDDYDPCLNDGKAPKTSGTKRKAAEPVPLPDLDWKEMQMNGTLGKLKVDELKAYCAANSLPRSGKKADLMERVERHLDQA